MLVTSAPGRTPALKAANPPAPTPEPTPQDQHAPTPETGLKLIGKEAGLNAVRWGNAVGTVTGGAGGLLGTTASLYVGVLGGAVLGAAVGAGAGPVVGALGSSGALNFIGNVFSTTGTMAKVGVAVGGAAMAAGAWDLGQSLGTAVGKPLGALGGGVVGLGQGSWKAFEVGMGAKAPLETPAGAASPKQVEHTKELPQMGPGMKAAAAVLGGAGMLAGGVGGGLMGASLASAGSLVGGLMARNVSLAALGGAAGFGGAVGGVIGLVVGGRGGWKLALGAQAVSNFVKDRVARDDWSIPGLPKVEKEGEPQVQRTTGRVGFSSGRLALNMADLTASAFYGLHGVTNDPSAFLGIGLAGLHLVSAAVDAANASSNSTLNGSDPARRAYFFQMGLGDLFTAIGHASVMMGAGAWGIPIILAGSFTTSAADLKYSANRKELA